MTEWLDLSARLEGHWAYLVAIPTALAFVHLAYLRSAPPVSPSSRWLLWGFRCSALGLLLIVLADPVFDILSKKAVKPQILLLIDTSPSMSVGEEPDGQRIRKAVDALSMDAFQQVLSRADVSYWAFAEDAHRLSADVLSDVEMTVPTAGRATDLTRALSTSLTEAPDLAGLLGILLLSDGGHNLGQDPVRWAEETGVPVFALGAGEEDDYPADIQIAAAVLPERGYTGRALPLDLMIRSWGYTGREVTLAVEEGGETIIDRPLVLAGDGLLQPISLEVTPRDVGPHIYRVSVGGIEGELSAGNNEALVFTRIVQNRVLAHIVAGGPGADLAFLQRTLSADSTISISQWVHGEGPSHPEVYQALDGVRDADVVVLVDPDPEVFFGTIGESLRGHVNDGGGLLFVAGPRSLNSWNPSTPLADVLPVDLSPSTGSLQAKGSAGLALSSQASQHPVFRTAVIGTADSGDPWTQLPPLAGWIAGVRARPRATVLVESVAPRQPVITAGRHGRGRVIAVIGTGFWRMDLLASGSGDGPRALREFWRNSVKWLAIEETEGRVRASSERHIYRGGEDVKIVAEVTDELMRPTETATVSATVDSTASQIVLRAMGPGRYRGQWSGLPPGRYTFTVSAEVQGTTIGTDSGQFAVETSTLESIDVRPNHQLLREIARASGGEYRPLADWADLIDRFDKPPRLISEMRQVSFWEQWWICPLIIGFLATEWFVRKRNGML